MVPLHPNKHAYQSGKSVETSLHQLVVRVEKALDQQETALGVFLHRGAYNNASFDSMCDGLAEHRVRHTKVRCIRATLKGRGDSFLQEGCRVQVVFTRWRVVATPVVPRC
jgi:hypothetical protein